MSVKEKVKKVINSKNKSNTYIGIIIPNKNAKQIYTKVFGEHFSNDFYLSNERYNHILKKHKEINFSDILYCINNPNVITLVKENEQVNIISIFAFGKYDNILVDVKLNKKNEIEFNKNGILSARYLSNGKLKKEANRNKIIFQNVDIFNCKE